jgi:threonine synthase
MLYLSTRGHPERKKFCDILLEGLAPDGGLYLPEHYLLKCCHCLSMTFLRTT